MGQLSNRSDPCFSFWVPRFPPALPVLTSPKCFCLHPPSCLGFFGLLFQVSV